MTNDGIFGVVLWTTDIPALADFLVDVAGMELEQRIPGYASLLAGGVRISLHADETFRGHPWYDALTREGVARGIGAELRVRVDDVHNAYTLALRRGALAIEAPCDIDGTRECQVMGPDGYLVTLWQPLQS
jgi:catechol 2,3-dioxygenase-like lactoylglutathione lyase family enzyme